MKCYSLFVALRWSSHHNTHRTTDPGAASGVWMISLPSRSQIACFVRKFRSFYCWCESYLRRRLCTSWERRAIFQRSEGESYDLDSSEGVGSNSGESNPGLIVDNFVGLLNIEGNFVFEKATHDDFKSAVIQTLGSDKGQVGDIIVTGERGAEVVVQPECCELICRNLKKVCSVPIDRSRLCRAVWA